MAASGLPTNAYEVRATLKELQKSLQCPICLEVLNDPHNTLCGHSYCKECIVTAITSSKKKPKCPLCKEPITKRSLNKNERLAEILEAVEELEKAVIKDTGITNTPPKVAPHLSGVTGTPGVQLHSVLHPTPLKPRPLETGGSAGEPGEGVESEGGDMREQVRQFSSYSATSRRKRKLSQGSPGLSNGASTSSHPHTPTPSPSPTTPHRRNKFQSLSTTHSLAPTNQGNQSSREDPANEALLEALEGAPLRLSTSQSNESSLGQRQKHSLRSRDQTKPQSSPVHTIPTGVRETERDHLRGRSLKKAPPTTWLDSSSESDDDEAIQLATPLLYSARISLSARPLRFPKDGGSTRGAENRPPNLWAPQNTSLDWVTSSEGEVCAADIKQPAPYRVRRLRAKPRKAKQLSLDFFCSRCE